ncbi:YgiT-type zinc finger protein [Candidatus Desantisbacteria bacterium]|nr:YgiT-type zinc finger protein [Candidatus Desantisbacteria bacterium]
MKGDFCRMCGSNKLRQEKRNILLESQHKEIKDISIWICEDCQEEFIDDLSINKLYVNSVQSRRKTYLEAA